MDGVWPYLFRGTTLGWPGNKCLEKLNLTPTSTDPLVATLFALECNRHGAGIVYFARWEIFRDRIGGSNVLARQECEIALSLLPLEFADAANGNIDALEVRKILLSMGFQVPEAIADRGFLSASINQSNRRLTLAELHHFWNVVNGDQQ